MATGYGFQVTGVVDGLTRAGEESGIRDIGGTTVKGNIVPFNLIFFTFPKYEYSFSVMDKFLTGRPHLST